MIQIIFLHNRYLFKTQIKYEISLTLVSKYNCFTLFTLTEVKYALV